MLTVDITPPTNVYATFGRLNYTPWHAIAEFVDNATQSFYENQAPLREALGRAPRLTVDIRHLQGQALVISDNAMGMGMDELERALRLNAPPPDTSGRSEFGMGLKTAACWFGKLWSISTSKLGEPYRYEVVFDVDKIADSSTRSLSVVRVEERPEVHGTTLTIDRMTRPVAGRQVAKTKNLLASIYRRDLRDGHVLLKWNGKALAHEASELFQWDREGTLQPARVEIDCYVVDPMTNHKHHVHGWVGAMLKMSAVESGLSFLRRGRMILGGPDGGWKPTELVGSSNSHSGKRMIGEIDVDSFPVNFTKDGFAWDGGLEDALIDTLAPLVAPLKDFADNARVRVDSRVEPHDFVRAVDEVQQGVNHPVYREAVSGAMQPSLHELAPELVGDTTTTSTSRQVPKELVVPLGTGSITARLSLFDGGPQQSWLSLSHDPSDVALLHVRLNTGNRFVLKHLEDERERTLVAKFALAVALAEEQARAVFGEDVPPEELREFLSLCLDHSVSE